MEKDTIPEKTKLQKAISKGMKEYWERKKKFQRYNPLTGFADNYLSIKLEEHSIKLDILIETGNGGMSVVTRQELTIPEARKLASKLIVLCRQHDKKNKV